MQALAGVKETDLIVMDLRLVDNEKVLLKPCFGFIENCSRCVLRNHHYINATRKKLIFFSSNLYFIVIHTASVNFLDDIINFN